MTDLLNTIFIHNLLKNSRYSPFPEPFDSGSSKFSTVGVNTTKANANSFVYMIL